MAGIRDLLGENGLIEDILLWGIIGQVVSNLLSPAFTALLQQSQADHPNMVLTSDILARAVVQTFTDKASAEHEAAKSGIDAERFDILLKLAEVRLSPADLAEAVLRSYLTLSEGEQQARLQGVTTDRFKVLTDLAGDAPGPDQLVQAVRRKIIPATGKGPASVSYEQGIAETRLHDKWGEVLLDLGQAILSPQDAAQAVVRGFLAHDAGASLAALSGVDAAEFTIMVDLAGDAPAPGQLAEALRRQVIPYDSGNPATPGFLQGIREGRLADKWAPMIRALSVLWPTPVDALQALLKGQVTHQEAEALYKRFGGDPEFFTLLFNTQGESPTPLELVLMGNRGYIPWTGLGPDVASYEQGFKEGRWKNKWEAPYRKFAQYVPPESTVVTLLAHGVITPGFAATELAKQGMRPELVKAYIDEAHTEALTDYRGATVAIVLEAYHASLIGQDDATNILEQLHVTPLAAKFMLAYEDIRRAFEATSNAMSRIRSLYAARKITHQTVTDNLAALGIPAAQIPAIVASWQIENSVSVKVLTETQIIDAVEIGALTSDEGLTELENIGYTPFDAWVLMSVKAKGPLPNKPAQGPAPPQGQVTPGTT